MFTSMDLALCTEQLFVMLWFGCNDLVTTVKLLAMLKVVYKVFSYCGNVYLNADD